MTSRRLAAILAADVVGYSAMMEGDEERTASRIRALRSNIIEPALEQHSGRLVKAVGDGVFAEFSSPVEAVRAALVIQQRLRAEMLLKLNPSDSILLQRSAALLAFLGEPDRARDLFERALAIDPDDIQVRYNAACTYSMLGDLDAAITSLENWMLYVGLHARLFMLRDSDFDPIRSHPRYHDLLSRLGLSEVAENDYEAT